MAAPRNRNLVLSRFTGESVRVVVGGVEFWVTVGEVNRHGQVKLWIEAPCCVEIWREELLDGEREMLD